MFVAVRSNNWKQYEFIAMEWYHSKYDGDKDNGLDNSEYGGDESNLDIDFETVPSNLVLIMETILVVMMRQPFW